MMDQDMLFRGGLMLAVLFLAGIFGASLGERMKDDPIVEMENVLREFGTIVSTLHQQDPGSSITVSFGGPSGPEEGLYILPSELDDHYFEIRFCQGLMTIRSGGYTSSLAFGPWLVPAMPPTGSVFISPSISRNISREAGGYTITTPVVLKLVRPEICESGEVFIFPEGSENVEIPSGIADLQLLILESGVLSPGWKMDAVIECSDILGYEHPLLLIDMSFPSVISGSCPLPVLLPNEFEIDPALLCSPSGSIRFYKEVVLGNDGIMAFRAGSELI